MWQNWDINVSRVDFFFLKDEVFLRISIRLRFQLRLLAEDLLRNYQNNLASCLKTNLNLKTNNQKNSKKIVRRHFDRSLWLHRILNQLHKYLLQLLDSACKNLLVPTHKIEYKIQDRMYAVSSHIFSDRLDQTVHLKPSTCVDDVVDVDHFESLGILIGKFRSYFHRCRHCPLVGYRERFQKLIICRISFWNVVLSRKNYTFD